MKVINWFLATFAKGDGSKRATAFALMLCVAYIHLKYINFENATTALAYDLLAIGFLFGLIKIADIIAIKNGSIISSTSIKTEEKTIIENGN